MFKRLVVLFCLLLLTLPAYAAIYIVEPVDEKVLPVDSGIVHFGKIARGETLKVVIKKKSDLASEWQSFEADSPLLLPLSFSHSQSIETDKTLIASIKVATDAPVSIQRIKFTAMNASQPMFSESFYATVSVQESLLGASIDSLNKDTMFADKVPFNLLLNNDSIAEHSVRIESTLPNYWFSTMTVLLKPNETKTVELSVSPYSYGEKNFSFVVSSMQNSSSFSFPAQLNVKPTLIGMYQAPIGGFPLFSPALLPQYLVIGFLSIFG